MLHASLVLVLLALAFFFYKLPWIYEKFTDVTDDQMDDVAKVNKKSEKRAAKRNK